jgi:hypothetical protein
LQRYPSLLPLLGGRGESSGTFAILPPLFGGGRGAHRCALNLSLLLSLSTVKFCKLACACGHGYMNKACRVGCVLCAE